MSEFPLRWNFWPLIWSISCFSGPVVSVLAHIYLRRRKKKQKTLEEKENPLLFLFCIIIFKVVCEDLGSNFFFLFLFPVLSCEIWAQLFASVCLERQVNSGSSAVCFFTLSFYPVVCIVCLPVAFSWLQCYYWQFVLVGASDVLCAESSVWLVVAECSLFFLWIPGFSCQESQFRRVFLAD